MRSRFGAAFLAGGIAIIINTLALKLADLISLPTAHGGLLRLISPWLSGPLRQSGLTYAWLSMDAPPPNSTVFQIGFHIAVGIGMALFYAYVVEGRLYGQALVKGLIYAGVVWLLNAAVVLPVTGEGFAGSAYLSLAGMLCRQLQAQIDRLYPGLRTACRSEKKRFGLRLLEDARAGRLVERAAAKPTDVEIASGVVVGVD